MIANISKYCTNHLQEKMRVVILIVLFRMVCTMGVRRIIIVVLVLLNVDVFCSFCYINILFFQINQTEKKIFLCQQGCKGFLLIVKAFPSLILPIHSIPLSPNILPTSSLNQTHQSRLIQILAASWPTHSPSLIVAYKQSQIYDGPMQIFHLTNQNVGDNLVDQNEWLAMQMVMGVEWGQIEQLKSEFGSVWSVDLGFFDLFFLFKINFELVNGKGGDLLFDDLDEAGEVFLALCGRERLDQDILIFADLVAFNLFGAAL